LLIGRGCTECFASGNQEIRKKHFLINHEEHEGTAHLSAGAPQFFIRKQENREDVG
jgi:hypothetical protein